MGTGDGSTDDENDHSGEDADYEGSDQWTINDDDHDEEQPWLEDLIDIEMEENDVLNSDDDDDEDGGLPEFQMHILPMTMTTIAATICPLTIHSEMIEY